MFTVTMFYLPPDVDECTHNSTNPCKDMLHVCNNTQGHYTCDLCPTGYKASSDQTHCIGMYMVIMVSYTWLVSLPVRT